jgi:hypothetical protein
MEDGYWLNEVYLPINMGWTAAVIALYQWDRPAQQPDLVYIRQHVTHFFNLRNTATNTLVKCKIAQIQHEIGFCIYSASWGTDIINQAWNWCGNKPPRLKSCFSNEQQKKTEVPIDVFSGSLKHIGLFIPRESTGEAPVREAPTSEWYQALSFG